MNHKLYKYDYVGSFLKFRCVGDVMNAAGMFANPTKEISETMSIIVRMRPIILDNTPMKYSILDLCAGHCLTSILAAHLFPIKHAVAVDIREKNQKRFHSVRKFYYVKKNIYDDDIIKMIDENTIIISIHPCQNLAKRVIDLYNNSSSPLLFLIPCCNGRIKCEPKTDKYVAWCNELYSLLIDKSSVTIERDEYCLSEKNIVIHASKF